MKTSSTRLRLGAALAVTTLGLVSLGGSAFAGENGQGDDRRNDQAAAATAEERGNADNGNGGNVGTADTDEETAVVTEDDDAAAADEGGVQTPNNVADEGDNMHPSGKDRSVENGGSGNQGQSTSTPDQDGRGPERDLNGTDKPGGTGGDDLNDQDANNGCGNDDDFEDDNEGLCGSKRPVKETPPEVGGETVVRCPEGSTMPTGGTEVDDCKKESLPIVEETLPIVDKTKVAEGAVLADQLQNEAPITLAASETPAAQVLGVTIERAAPAVETAAPAPSATTGTSVLGASFTRGSALARTGFGLTLVALLGLALVLVGAGLKRAGRSEHGPLV